MYHDNGDVFRWAWARKKCGGDISDKMLAKLLAADKLDIKLQDMIWKKENEIEKLKKRLDNLNRKFGKHKDWELDVK